jgi:hypothetical protein
MHYIKVAWNHNHPYEPVTLYSECDDDGWELRKVEVFRDGRSGYASKTESAEGTRLGMEPIPSLDDIARQSEFHPVAITKEEFDKVWTATQTSVLSLVRS